LSTPEAAAAHPSDERRVVIITGATGPLGRTAAAAFVADGDRVALVGTAAERLASTAADLHLADGDWVAAVADLRQEADARAVVTTVLERFGRIDVLLQLVGGYTGGTALVELDSEALATMLDQHVWATFHMTRAVVPTMTSRGFGRIVAVLPNMTANPGPRMAAYVAARAGQEAMLRSLAREVAGAGVTVNTLAVRAIDVAHERESAPSPRNATWATPEEIVATMRFLCSDAAAAINGARIPLDGRG
jgi:NAD(P)-dependent dehydrogenase (short-subunit alcohol dehydrogenase family)